MEGDKRLDKLESFLDKLHNKGTVHLFCSSLNTFKHLITLLWHHRLSSNVSVCDLSYHQLPLPWQFHCAKCTILPTLFKNRNLSNSSFPNLCFLMCVFVGIWTQAWAKTRPPPSRWQQRWKRRWWSRMMRRLSVTSTELFPPLSSWTPVWF